MSNYFEPIQNAQFVVLTTYRRNGEAMPSTVWFAEEAGKVYITTMQGIGKVKRLRANPQATLASSDRVGVIDGPVIEVRGRVLEPEEFEVAIAALEHKYGDMYRTMVSQMDATRPPNSRIFLEFVPAY